MKTKNTFYTIIIILSAVAGCTSHEDRSQVLQQFSATVTQAQSAIQASEFLAAEHYLLNALNLLNQASENDKVMNVFALLAPIEKKLGKISSAREHYQSLLRYYQTNGMRAEEFAVTIKLSELDRLGGGNRKALDDLFNAANASDVLGLKEDYINAKLEIVSLYLDEGLFLNAKSEMNNLIQRVLKTGNSLLAEKVFVSAGEVFAKTKDYSRSLRYFSAAESIIKQSKDKLLQEEFYFRYGKSLARQGQWNAALACYTNAYALARQIHDNNTVYCVTVEIGELYFQNFDHATAQKYFQETIETAQRSGNSLLSTFALLRLADCSAREFARFHDQQNGITATQRYEQAYSSFARMNYPFGEAATLFRLASLKRLAQDDAAAITFYKRGMSAYINSLTRFGAGISLFRLPSFVDDEYSIFNAQKNVKPLLALLLKQGRNSEAVYYLELASIADEVSTFERYTFTLIDPDKQHLLDRYNQLRTRLTTLQSEILLQNSIQQQMRTRESIVLRNTEIQNIGKQLTSLRNSVAQRFSTLLPLFGPDVLDNSQLPSSIELGTTLVQYIFVENQVWACITNAEGSAAIKISSFGDGLKKKITAVINQFQMQPEDRTPFFITASMTELYDFLIRPVEKYAQQKFVFILPEELQKFPMHALLKNGKPLIASIEVAYIPSLFFYQTVLPASRYYSTASAVGISTETKWGLEYELRGLRNYFRASTIWLNQHATEETLLKTTGEVLQISTTFQQNPLTKLQELSLSTGSISSRGTWLQASRLLNLSPYRSVFLSNLTDHDNSITYDLPAFVLMNKTSSAIVSLHGLTPRLSKQFSEYYYSALAQTQNTMEAYQRALGQLSSDKKISDDMSWATYFYFGK